jgi:hypothetical protein
VSDTNDATLHAIFPAGLLFHDVILILLECGKRRIEYKQRKQSDWLMFIHLFYVSRIHCHILISKGKVYSLRSSAKGNLFVPRPNSNFMKRNFRYSGTILRNSLPPSLKLIQDIDLFKRKYTDYLMSKQNNGWLWYYIHYTQIVKFCCEYVCIVWNCIWLLLSWGPQRRLAYCCQLCYPLEITSLLIYLLTNVNIYGKCK